MLATVMIVPAPRARIRGSTARAQWKTPTIQRDRAVDEAPRVAEERS
jgi:hypothetical protein